MFVVFQNIRRTEGKCLSLINVQPNSTFSLWCSMITANDILFSKGNVFNYLDRLE